MTPTKPSSSLTMLPPTAENSGQTISSMLLGLVVSFGAAIIGKKKF